MIQTEISLNGQPYLLDSLNPQEALRKLITLGGILQKYEGIEIPFFAFDAPVFEKLAKQSYVPKSGLTTGHEILSRAYSIGNKVESLIQPVVGISIQTPYSKSWEEVLTFDQLKEMQEYFLREPLTREERMDIAKNLVSEASSLESTTLTGPWHRTQEASQKLAKYKILIEEFGEQEGIELLEQERTENYQEHGRRLEAQDKMVKSPGINLSNTVTRYPGGTRKIKRYR